MPYDLFILIKSVQEKLKTLNSQSNNIHIHFTHITTGGAVT